MPAESHGYTSPRTFAEQNTCSNLSSRLRPRFTAALISYELFERCASILNGAPITFSQLRTADVFRESAILDRRRHSSAVEQLFRKSLALFAVLQAWKADTNRHTYQLFAHGAYLHLTDADALNTTRT